MKLVLGLRPSCRGNRSSGLGLLGSGGPAMNRRTSVAVAEITPTVDIEKIYRQLKHLRKMVKQAESLKGRLAKKPAPSSSKIKPQRRYRA
jgi:hypothetical protein